MSVLGQNVPRREGAAKLTGQARFVDDLPREAGVWWGATVRSSAPGQRLLGVTPGAGFPADAVLVTAADIPGTNRVPLIVADQPALAEHVIRHAGEPVALVAAPDRDTLASALAAVEVRTEPLSQQPTPPDHKVIHIRKGDAVGAMQDAPRGVSVVSDDVSADLPRESLSDTPRIAGANVPRSALGDLFRPRPPDPIPRCAGI